MEMEEEMNRIKNENIVLADRNKSYQKTKTERAAIEHKASDLSKQNKDLEKKKKSLEGEK